MRLKKQHQYIAIACFGAVILYFLDRATYFQHLKMGDFLLQFGVIGMFCVALIGSTSILIQIPYTLPMLSIALHGTSLEYMLSLGLAAGFGAGCGKSLSYLMVRHFIVEQRSFDWLDKLNPKYLPVIIFLVVASPLPDDAVIIPLAALRYGLKRLILPLQMGKIAHNLGMAMLFYFASDFSAQYLVGKFSASGVILLALVLLIAYQLGRNRHIITQNITLHPVNLNEIPST